MKAPGPPDPVPGIGRETLQRIDQWLWFARMAKSRTLAQALIEGGKVRVNRVKIAKTSTIVRPGDVLTLTLGRRVMSIEILGVGYRRGPAPEAQALYRDLTPPQPVLASGVGQELDAGRASRQAVRIEGSGRPTKRERRLVDKFRGRE